VTNKKVTLTEDQRKALNNLWFVYGNYGMYTTPAGHHFIQCLLENDEDCRVFYKPPAECLAAVDKVLNG
jgi:hypothetical protein